MLLHVVYFTEVVNGKCQTLQDGKASIFYASLRHVKFPNCKTKTSMCFNCELEIHKQTNKAGLWDFLVLQKFETLRKLGQNWDCEMYLIVKKKTRLQDQWNYTNILEDNTNNLYFSEF